MKRIFGSLALFFHAHLAISASELTLGQPASEVRLSDKTGGYVEGNTPWVSTLALQGKVSVLFYVAPAHKDMNQHVSAALKAAQFPEDKFQSYAVVNMAASAWPNFMIEGKLTDSQKEFPRTKYVKDKTRALVTAWNLQDDSSNVVVFNKEGAVIFLMKGKATSEQATQLVELVRKSL